MRSHFQVAIKVINSEYMMTLITQPFEKFNCSDCSHNNRDNHQMSTSLVNLRKIALEFGKPGENLSPPFVRYILKQRELRDSLKN